ncbi:MAG: hypothetical protein A2001_19280 [Treponema sp. GWC1_61_84]|nr:MAG: hypothetical protein A2001_19280 [Treponema sp. GWC1_61_84]
MEIQEVKKYLTEDEAGKALLEELKAPILAKNKELLGSLHEANGKTAQAEQRAADSSRILEEERAAVSTLAIDKELSRLLKQARTIEPAIPGLVAELKEAHGLQVKADGLNRTAMSADGRTLENVIDEWSSSDASKALRLAVRSSGSGAMGGAGIGAVSLTRESLARMNPRALAQKLDDPGFRASVSGIMGK